MRQIGKLVSDLRDAHVRLQTLIELRDDDAKRFAHLENLLSIERESFSAAFAGWQKQAIPKLEALSNRLAQWPLDDLTWKSVCAAVAKSYRRGRNALDRALKKPSAECMHAWRKEVKQLWYQLRLLQPLNPVVLEKIAADAKTLGQLLGLDHDYAFLLERFDEKQPEPDLQKRARRFGKADSEAWRPLTTKRDRAWKTLLRRTAKSVRQTHLNLHQRLGPLGRRTSIWPNEKLGGVFLVGFKGVETGRVLIRKGKNGKGRKYIQRRGKDARRSGGRITGLIHRHIKPIYQMANFLSGSQGALV